MNSGGPGTNSGFAAYLPGGGCKMKSKKRLFENIIHGIFLILGLITVGSVLLITVYLIVSGIPAIKEIGLWDFLFGNTDETTCPKNVSTERNRNNLKRKSQNEHNPYTF